jgi:hypothetical protein
MIASNTLERDDFSSGEGVYNLLQRPAKLGTANRTCDRLGMKAPVHRVFILPTAVRTHLKLGHSRERSVIGQACYESVSRPAMSTVGEGIEIASVGRIENFL